MTPVLTSNNSTFFCLQFIFAVRLALINSVIGLLNTFHRLTYAMRIWCRGRQILEKCRSHLQILDVRGMALSKINTEAKKYRTFSLTTPWRRIRWKVVKLLLFWTSAPNDGGLSVSRPGRFTAGKELLYPLNRRVGGFQSQTWRFAEEKNLVPLQGH